MVTTRHDDTLIFLFDSNRKRTSETLSTCDPVKWNKWSLLSSRYPPPSILLHHQKKQKTLSTHQKLTAWQETKTQRFSFLPSGRCSVGPPACSDGDKNKFTSAPVCCLQWHQVRPSVELRHVAHTLPEKQVTDEKDGLPLCQGNSLAG